MTLQTLKLSVSLPDDTHPEMQLRLSANDIDCDGLISLPLRQRCEPVGIADVRCVDAATKAYGDYMLSRCAGI